MIQKQKNGKQNLIQKIIKQKIFLKKLLMQKMAKVVIKLGEKINFLNAKKLFNDGLKDILVSKESLFGKFLHKDIKINDEENGTLKIGTELNDTIIQQIIDANFMICNYLLQIQLIKVLIY